MWMFDHPGWWGIGMMIVMVVFWAGLIALIVWAVSRFTKSHSADDSRKPDALDIARERYARGEITKEQFEQLKKDLRS